MELLQRLLAGHKVWLRQLWRANRLRVLATVIPLVLLSFCAGQALGAEPTRLAGENNPFTLTVATEVAYCSTPTHSACEWRLYQPGTYTASNQSWGNDPQPGVQKAAWGRAPAAPATPAPPAAPAPSTVMFSVCAIDWEVIEVDLLPFSVKGIEWGEPVPIDAAEGKLWAAWPCEGKRVQAQTYTASEFAEFMLLIGTAPVKALFGKGSFVTQVNAWVAAHPPSPYTASEMAFIRAKEAELAALWWPPSLPAAPTWRVAPQDRAADRPVVRATASGTSTVSGVRVAFGTPCSPDRKVGNYMSVEGQLDTQGRVLGDVYAICQEAK